MTIDTISDMLHEGVGVALMLGGPMLALSMLVGVVVAIFQAVTQIHEQTISFILKLAVVVGFLLVGGQWMLSTLQDYLKAIFNLFTL